MIPSRRRVQRLRISAKIPNRGCWLRVRDALWWRKKDIEQRHRKRRGRRREIPGLDWRRPDLPF
jgi:hypothetical protein